MNDEVIEWDVIDGGILGALIRCPDCPCVSGRGCDGDGVLFQPYHLHGREIDLWGQAEILIALLDEPPAGEFHPQEST